MAGVNSADLRYPEHGKCNMKKDNKTCLTAVRLNLTRRQFLKGNILLAAMLAFSRLPLKAFKEAFRSAEKPNISNREARFYSNLAG